MKLTAEVIACARCGRKELVERQNEPDYTGPRPYALTGGPEPVALDLCKWCRNAVEMFARGQL